MRTQESAQPFDLANDAYEQMTYICSHLDTLRQSSSQEDWSGPLRAKMRASEWLPFAHLCPFTKRSFEKPRGYAGDAVILDYIYGIETTESPFPSGRAQEVYEFTRNSPACRAVRYRRSLIAQLVDEAALQRKAPSILSVAAGHLREFDLSLMAQRHALGRWVALDQDKLSVDVINENYGKAGVSGELGSVRDLLVGNKRYSGFDFVYAAGLFDYLPDDVARRLITVMEGMLNPGGRLLVANFLPAIFDAGYMETFMDWHLIYRNEDDMLALFEKGLFENDAVKMLRDPDHNIVFAIATKAEQSIHGVE